MLEILQCHAWTKPTPIKTTIRSHNWGSNTCGTCTGITCTAKSMTTSVSSIAASTDSIRTTSTCTGTSSSGNKKVCRVGIFGVGTVGGGIVQLLQDKKDYLYQLTNGTEIQVVSICVNDLKKQRDFELPSGTKLTTDYDVILNDDTIDMVVEVMGGINESKNIVYNALQSRKSVVTANKALISKYLPEIEQLLAKVNSDPTKNKVQFRYEAAVCGGIPIIRSLQSDYVSDSIQMVCGIINGCTNFMLTGMDQYGMSYDEALLEASKLGYAEADPTLDVGGFDARSKLRILLRLAYGIDVDEDQIACRGITELSKLDFAYAKMMGGTIKLVGVAKSISSSTVTTGSSTGDDKKVAAFVSPCYVTNNEALANVNGATNAI
jgi:homoserine dehydrogenase